MEQKAEFDTFAEGNYDTTTPEPGANSDGQFASEGDTSTPNPELDTFDNWTVDPDEVEIPEQEAQEKEPEQDVEKPEQTDKDLLETQEEGEESGEEKQEGEGEQQSEQEAEKPKGKQVKGKSGDKDVELDSETTFKAKVDGKMQDVTLQQLLNDFSGRESWNAKFSELDKERNEYKQTIAQDKQQLEQYKTEKAGIQKDLTEIIQAMTDKEGNPLDGVFKLLDWSGVNTLDFEKRLMEGLYPTIAQLQEMDDVERELYWRNKEVDYLRQQQETSRSRSQQTEAQQQELRQIDEMRKSQGVSEEDFLNAHNALLAHAQESGTDPNSITVNDVLDLAVNGPHYQAAEEIASPYLESMETEAQDSLISSVVESLRDGLTHDEIKEILNDVYGNDEAALEEKLQSGPKQVVTPKAAPVKSDAYETFDDFDEYGY